MTPSKFVLLAATLGIVASHNSLANVRVPRLVGDHMVLQRGARLALWGWADRGEKVTLEFQDQRVTTKADARGQWTVSLGPFRAGGPYDLLIEGRSSVRLKDILVGDVWLASGQSNMEFPVGPEGVDYATGMNNFATEIENAHYPLIRLFHVKRNADLGPRADVESEGWRDVTPNTVATFSAVAYLFGRELHERYHVPIGLIESSWGGTLAEAWMSEFALRRFPEFQEQINAISRISAADRKAYREYWLKRHEWDRKHLLEDHGRENDRDVWADPEYDSSSWPTIVEPRPDSTWGKDFNGFSGVVWFRRELTLSSDLAGMALHLYLGTLAFDDQVYFNGVRIGETRGIQEREYVVPGEYVHTGRNVIAVRMVGVEDPTDWGIGMYGPEEGMRAEIGDTRVPLAGAWAYKPGTDLDDMPVASEAIIAARPVGNSPTELFNGMIHPLTAFKIKGVIWYQGEANALDHRSIQYRTLFPALIEDWRQKWGYSMPFLFVQLAGFGPDQAESDECPWAELREAQAMALSLPDTGMATAIDIGDAREIHPRNKLDVSHRLALVAEKVAYGDDVVDSGPAYRAMRIEGNRIRVTFQNVGGGLRVKDRYGYLRGFEIAGGNGEFTWAQARQDGSDIIVFNDLIEHPVFVRYDWGNTPDGNLFNAAGLPAMPFRTDAPITLGASR